MDRWYSLCSDLLFPPEITRKAGDKPSKYGDKLSVAGDKLCSPETPESFFTIFVIEITFDDQLC